MQSKLLSIFFSKKKKVGRVRKILQNNFKRAMDEDKSPSLEEIEEIYGKILTNIMREICFGLLLAESKIDHSCDPNTT